MSLNKIVTGSVAQPFATAESTPAFIGALSTGDANRTGDVFPATTIAKIRRAFEDDAMRQYSAGIEMSFDIPMGILRPTYVELCVNKYASTTAALASSSMTVFRYMHTPYAYATGSDIPWKWVTTDFPSEYHQPPHDRMRAILRDRSAPAVRRHRSHLPPARDEREERARETLRALIGEARWRRFVRDGFVTVERDGLTYQVFPGTAYDNITRVYRAGVMVERLCCYLRGEFPPTDHLIMRFLLVLNDPVEFRRLCNVHRPISVGRAHTTGGGVPGVSLVAEFKRLKTRAA